MLRALLFFAYIGLAIYALLDCARTDQDEVRNLPKWAWLLIILFIQLLGSIAWLIAGKPRKRKKNNPRRIIPPDDDPDFLRGL
jgi:cbb3-type cytochrome oxidase subunit 3